MSKVAIVILNWNGQKLLEKFLPAVIQNTTYGDAEIIVADNASTDNSLAFLKDHYPLLRTIALDQNYGFAGGYNKALKQVNAEYYLLLNSDVAPGPRWLEPLMKIMEQNQKIGACMPKIKAYNSPKSFEYAGACGGFIDILGYPFCRGRILDHIETDDQQYNNELPIFWASGAALLIHSHIYLSAGGLDEDFFAHMEEIDLCWRIKNMGYQIMVVPSSEVFHVGGATLSQQNSHKTFLNFRNNLLMMIKNLSSKYFLAIILLRLFLDGIAALHFLLKKETHHFTAVFKAHLAFYSLLPLFIQKRKKLKPFHRRINHPEVYPQSVIWAFYIQKIKLFSQLKHFWL